MHVSTCHSVFYYHLFSKTEQDRKGHERFNLKFSESVILGTAAGNMDDSNGTKTLYVKTCFTGCTGL